jgi:hypothetical protein
LHLAHCDWSKKCSLTQLMEASEFASRACPII